MSEGSSLLKYVAVGVAILFLFLMLAAPSLMRKSFKTEAKADSETGNVNFTVEGTAELLNEEGNVVETLTVIPLEFYYGQTPVSAMRVTLTWQASGKGVDWATLQITVKATGTGGYAEQASSTQQSGQVEFILPISTAQLGRTPAQGEEVTWQMTVEVEGSVKDLVGLLLTAKPEPVTCKVKTTWVESEFTVTSDVTSDVGETQTETTASFTDEFDSLDSNNWWTEASLGFTVKTESGMLILEGTAQELHSGAQVGSKFTLQPPFKVEVRINEVSYIRQDGSWELCNIVLFQDDGNFVAFGYIEYDLSGNKLAVAEMRGGQWYDFPHQLAIIPLEFIQPAPSTNTWHTLGFEYDGSTLKCLFDGNVVKTLQVSYANPTLRIGCGVRNEGISIHVNVDWIKIVYM